jgi:hypothetical protein
VADDLMPAPPAVDETLEIGAGAEEAVEAQHAADVEDAETGESVIRIVLRDGRRWDAHYEQWSGAFVRRAKAVLQARGITDTPIGLVRSAIAFAGDCDLDTYEGLIVLAILEAGADLAATPELRYPMIDWQETGHARVVTDPST